MNKYLQSGKESASKMAPISSSLLEEEPELIDLIKRFVERLPERLEQLVRNYDQQEWDVLRDNIHDLKGVSGNFGFEELYKTARDTEVELLEKNYTGLPVKIEELLQICKRIEAGL